MWSDEDTHTHLFILRVLCTHIPQSFIPPLQLSLPDWRSAAFGASHEQWHTATAPCFTAHHCATKPHRGAVRLLIIAAVAHQLDFVQWQKRNPHKAHAGQRRVLCPHGTNKRDLPTDKPLPNFNTTSRLEFSLCELELDTVSDFESMCVCHVDSAEQHTGR